MPKILLFSDLHVHTHKNSTKRLQHCLDALEWVFKTAIDREIKNIIFLGDLFQDREKIHILSYQKVYEILEKYCGGESPKVNIYLTLGNHDLCFADRLDFSSVYPFNSIKNARVIRKCETINIEDLNIDFLPFTLNPLKSVSHFKNPSRVLCGHIALDGAKLNSYKVADISVEYEGDMVKVNSGVLSQWEKVFLGHYHGEQRIGNVEYIGSPLQLNFSEALETKHIIILDTETLEQEYIINNFSPRHLIINENELSKHDLNNTFIKFHPKDMTSSNLIDMKNTLLNEFNILTFELAPPESDLLDNQVQEKLQNTQDIFSTDKIKILVKYMDAVGTQGLDRERLLKVGETLCQESQIN